MIRIAVLPGDGIGPEVIAEAVKILKAVGQRFHHHFEFSFAPIGGAALKESGLPLPLKTLEICLRSDAALLGAVGSPEFDQNPPSLKPESGLLLLRKELGAFANLRPVVLHQPLIDASPLKREVVEGTDVLIVRELTGGLYFGQPRGFPEENLAVNTMRYSKMEVERIARIAFEAARKRKKKVHSIDKANVLETSQLWRKVVIEIAADYPEVKLEHMYVDNCAMQLVANPRQFDVILTENLFGDILSDEAAMITGSIGMLPSASIGGRVGLYEPIHGSAPDIAGKGIANPLATIASAAMLLRYSLNLETEARAIESAIASALQAGHRTADLIRTTQPAVSTCQMGDLVTAQI